jgi:hypothetical protein
VVDVKTIAAVVSMPPHDHHLEPDKSDQWYFVWECTGLELGILGGFQEEPDKEDERKAEEDGTDD